MRKENIRSEEVSEECFPSYLNDEFLPDPEC